MLYTTKTLYRAGDFCNTCHLRMLGHSGGYMNWKMSASNIALLSPKFNATNSSCNIKCYNSNLSIPTETQMSYFRHWPYRWHLVAFPFQYMKLMAYRTLFLPCDLEIWWMTLENNRASLLCCFKLCATFHSHWWIQTGVTVRKRPIWVKFDDF